jgi:type IV secretion system protein VirD4
MLLVRSVARLGLRLAVVAGVVIAAARLFVRYVDRRPSEAAADAFNVGVGVVLAGAVAAWMWGRARGGTGGGGASATSQGTARWGSPRQVATSAGLIVGRDRAWPRPLVRYGGDAHLLTLAPTGAGKGLSCVIPNLLAYPGSVLVTDPKGENYAVTASRRRELGHRVLALDPFDLVGGDASFNPIEELNPASADALDDAVALAEMLVLREPHESGDTMFWSEEAKALLAGIILHVAASESVGRRTLATVWEYLSLPPRGLTQLWTEMARSTAARGAVSRAAARIRQKGDRVRSGILAQAQSHAHFLESPRLARVMRRSSFSFADLKTGQVSLYLVLPPDRIEAGRRWLRLLVGCALHGIVRTRVPSAHRVLLLLDEFPALGHMPPLERAVSLVRGYGATCWLLAQDLAQIKTLYPSAWPTFVANAGVVQAFGTNDVETAAYLSEMLGTTTVRAAGSARSHAAGLARLIGGPDARHTRSDSERARALLTPDEVRRLDPDTALLLAPGRDPMRVARVDYRQDGEFSGQFARNPWHAGGPDHRVATIVTRLGRGRAGAGPPISDRPTCSLPPDG